MFGYREPALPLWRGRAAGGRRAADSVQESGEVAGVSAAEDEALILYCARVTQRYVQNGQIHVERQSGTFVNDHLYRDVPGCSLLDRQGRRGADFGTQSLE